MAWTSIIAIYTLFWVLSCFLVMPFGMRTNEEVGKPNLPGQVESAPAHWQPGKVALRAAVVAAVTATAAVSSSTTLATAGANGVSAVARAIRFFASRRVLGSGATRSSRRHGPASARTTATSGRTGPSPAAAART